MGLDVYLYRRKNSEEEDVTFDRVEMPSPKYPDHLFKIGYWRSSHNDSGFNRMLRKFVGKDLYDVIQEVRSGTTHVKPNWKDALHNAQRLQTSFAKFLEAFGPYKVQEISSNPFKSLQEETVTSESEALTAFLSEINKGVNAKVGWQGKHGILYPKGIEVLGVIEGKSMSPVHGEVEAQYLIYKPKLEEGQGPYDWYTQALEIVIETIEYVLEQEDPTEYVLEWRV